MKPFHCFWSCYCRHGQSNRRISTSFHCARTTNIIQCNELVTVCVTWRCSQLLRLYSIRNLQYQVSWNRFIVSEVVTVDNLTGVFLPLFIAHAPRILYNIKKNYMPYFLLLHYWKKYQYPEWSIQFIYLMLYRVRQWIGRFGNGIFLFLAWAGKGNDAAWWRGRE